MDRLINYGGGWKFSTSNSEYGRGVMASSTIPKVVGGHNFSSPPAGNYYFPQNQPYNQQQPGHVHNPNCPNHGTTGYNTGTPLNTTAKFQVPGVGVLDNAVPTADHIEVLHGDAAQAYLAQQQQEQASNGDAGSGQFSYQQQPNYNYQHPPQTTSSTDTTTPTGRTVTIQATPSGIEDNTAPLAASGDGMQPASSIGVPMATVASKARFPRQYGGGDEVKSSGFSMDRNPRWRQSNLRMNNKGGPEPDPMFKLCGKCPNCKGVKDSRGYRPTTANFREEGLTGTGARQFLNAPVYGGKPRGQSATALINKTK